MATTMKPTDDEDSGELIISWSQAYHRGNALLYPPREIRDEIYKLALSTDRHEYPGQQFQKRVFNLHGICVASRQMRQETLPIFLKQTTFIVGPRSSHDPLNGRCQPDAAATLTYLTNVIPDGTGPQLVQSLRIGMLNVLASKRTHKSRWDEHDGRYYEYATVMDRDTPGRQFIRACTNMTSVRTPYG